MEVGTRDGVIWQQAFGRLDYDDEAPVTRTDTIFDLASLTKVIATTSLMMRLVEQGKLALSDRIADRIPDWRGNDRENVTLRSLLTHSSGLTAWLPFYRDHTGRTEFQHAICSLPLEYPPDTQSIYSDLGFILLGFIIEDAGGRSFERAGRRAADADDEPAAALQSSAVAAPVDRADRTRSVAWETAGR